MSVDSWIVGTIVMLLGMGVSTYSNSRPGDRTVHFHDRDGLAGKYCDSIDASSFIGRVHGRRKLAGCRWMLGQILSSVSAQISSSLAASIPLTHQPRIHYPHSTTPLDLSHIMGFWRVDFEPATLLPAEQPAITIAVTTAHEIPALKPARYAVVYSYVFPHHILFVVIY